MQIGTSAPIRDKVCCQGKKTAIHWCIFTMGRKMKPWVIAPYVMSALGYARQNLLNKERFHLWDCPEDIWMQTNEE